MICLDLLGDRARAVLRGALRQLHHREDRALILLRQEAGRRDREQTGRTRARPRRRRPARRRPPAPVAAPPPRSRRSRGRSRRARSASGRARCVRASAGSSTAPGCRLSALIAEISIETDTATANWRNSSPLIPGMNATGTNTDSSTSVIAMIGAVISRMALLVACLGVRCGSSSMIRSTFSITTIASSTTMPMASTSASSDTVFARVADRQQHGEGADQRDRHGDDRDQRGAQLAEEQEDHERDQDERLEQRVDDLLHGRRHEHRGVVEDVVGEIVREALAQLAPSAARTLIRDLHGIGARRLIDADRRRGTAVVAAELVGGLGAEVDPGDVAQPHDRAVRIGAQHDLVELRRRWSGAPGC